jgi:hypothetical protein
MLLTAEDIKARRKIAELNAEGILCAQEARKVKCLRHSSRPLRKFLCDLCGKMPPDGFLPESKFVR